MAKKDRDIEPYQQKYSSMDEVRSVFTIESKSSLFLKSKVLFFSFRAELIGITCFFVFVICTIYLTTAVDLSNKASNVQITKEMLAVNLKSSETQTNQSASISTLQPSEEQFSKFLVSVDKGDIVGLKTYIDGNFDVNKATNKDKEYVLSLRAQNGEHVVFGINPISHAAYAGQVEALKLLIASGAPLNAEVLSFAAKGESQSALKFLLQTNHKFTENELTFSAAAAAEFNRKANLILLLNSGANANPNQEIYLNETPLIAAVRNSNIDCIGILLRKGANPNSHQELTGITPIIMGVTYDRLDIVKLLVEAGADPTLKGGNLRPLDLAQAQGKTNIFKYLQSRISASSPSIEKKITDIRGSTFCEVDVVAGVRKKFVTYHANGAIYAINGTARGLAKQHNWKDGKSMFSASHMLKLLDDGLSKCAI